MNMTRKFWQDYWKIWVILRRVIGIVCAKHAAVENANYAVKVSYLYSLVSKANLDVDIAGNNKMQGKTLSKKVKTVKDFVYLIECGSR